MINVDAEFVPNQPKPVQQNQKVRDEQAFQHMEQNQNGVAWMQGQDPAVVVQAANLELKAGAKPEIAAPSFEDIVVFSSVDTADKISGAVGRGLDLSRLGMNWGALEEAYRESFKKSKSHNFLLERFMANVKFSGMKLLFSLAGVSATEQDKIQNEVRQEALKDIDYKLKQEWAYTKAMLEIVG